MTDQHSQQQWINAWLDSQRQGLNQWMQHWQQASGAFAHGGDPLSQWQSTLPPQAQDMVRSFQDLLHAGFGGEVTQVWQQLLQAFPVGPAREQQALWQEYLAACEAYQQHLQTLAQTYGQLFAQTLESMPSQVAQRAARGQPVSGIRELYELWVECGEQAFAPLARTETFMSAQAASANALARLKHAQQSLMEQWLKQHDLPTRSELNSVHLRLRELGSRVNTLERRLAQTQTQAAQSSSQGKTHE